MTCLVMIFIKVHSLGYSSHMGFITNPQTDQLPVGLLAQLAKHCTAQVVFTVITATFTYISILQSSVSLPQDTRLLSRPVFLALFFFFFFFFFLGGGGGVGGGLVYLANLGDPFLLPH